MTTVAFAANPMAGEHMAVNLKSREDQLHEQATLKGSIEELRASIIKLKKEAAQAKLEKSKTVVRYRCAPP